MKIFAGASSAALLASAAVYAQETATMTAGVTVLSTITITELTPMSFGSLFVAESDNIAGLASVTLDPAAGGSFSFSGPTGGANIISTDNAPVPGEYEVNIGVPNVELTLTSDTSGKTVALANTTDAVNISAATFVPTDSGAPGLFTTNADGILRFAAGVTLTTQPGSNGVDAGSASVKILENGEYTGDFQVSVNF